MPRGGLTMTLKMVDLDAPATGCGFAGKAFAVADGDGHVHVCDFSGQIASRKVHAGAVLCMASDEKTGMIATGGDDGKVVRVYADAEPEVVHSGTKWIDAMAASPRGHLGWAAGKTVFFLAKGAATSVPVATPSTVSALAFSPDGKWLGAAVYGGAMLISVADPAKTQMLTWQGAHQAIGFSPDGRFCVTSMLENALHVWRIDKPEEKHGRMGGYPSKPLSFAWTADGRFMATAGAEVLVLWPFSGPDGPIGQNAGVFSAEGTALLRTVATRPASQQMAVGYADGSVMLFDRKAQMFLPVAPADGGPVTGLGFSADGRMLGFIRENGAIGLAEPGKA